MYDASDCPGRGQLILNHSHSSERKGEVVPQRQMGYYSQERMGQRQSGKPRRRSPPTEQGVGSGTQDSGLHSFSKYTWHMLL